MKFQDFMVLLIHIFVLMGISFGKFFFFFLMYFITDMALFKFNDYKNTVKRKKINESITVYMKDYDLSFKEAKDTELEIFDRVENHKHM